MRSCLVELDENRVRFISAFIYNVTPDPTREGKYIASSTDKIIQDKFTHILKLTDNTYRDNYGYYFLTEEHPLFNAAIVTRTAIKYRLDDNFLVSHLLEGVRYLVRKSILEASAHYNK